VEAGGEYPNHLARKEDLDDAIVATEELITSVAVPVPEAIQGTAKQ
jgi:hypothetical protein